jgi:hypothetical protein
MKKHQFLGSLIAVACSCVLAACGGGGADFTAASTGNDNDNAAATTLTTSSNGTATPPASSIVDVLGNVWTVSNAYVYENGTQDPNAHDVSMLIFYSNSIYQKDKSGSFYKWTGASWDKCDDPQLIGTASANNTATPQG